MQQLDTAPLVVQVPRPTTVSNYKHRQSAFLGVVLIVVGTYSIVFNIVDLAVHATSLGAVGHGFWSGLMCVIAGGFGVGAARKRSPCSILAFQVLCIIAAVLCLGQLATALSSVMLAVSLCTEHFNYIYCVYVRTSIAMETLLAIMGFIGGVAAIWGSALGCQSVCCCNCCCCKEPHPQQFAIIGNNAALMAVPVTQQQSERMMPVVYPAQHPMQYPDTNPPPYLAGSYQFPDVPPCSPPRTPTPPDSSPQYTQSGDVSPAAAVSASFPHSSQPVEEKC